MTDFFKKTFPCYASNSFKILAENCIENISMQPHLHKTYFAYPSNEVKDFFVQSFIKKHSHIFGIRFITIQQFIHLSLKICYKKDLIFPSHYELMFFLEEKIAKLCKTNETLQEYIQNKESRIISLASNLSHVFLEYLLYGKDALPEWEKQNGWQQQLFKQVTAKWTSIIDAIEHCPPPPFSISLHIFGVDEIPKLYLHFFEKLSTYFSFTFYSLSPSPLFWGDLISQKKSAYLDQIFQKKKTNIKERIEFSQKAKGEHPLLSHFSSLGKPLYNYLQDHADTFNLYEDIDMHSNHTYIQKAILHQIKPQSPPFEDNTFTIHSAPSLLREIEILLSNICKTLQENNDLTPTDIAVLAPNIDLYFPYISFLFEKNNYPFSYTISGLKKTKHSNTLKALETLFSLIGSRFEKDQILSLFSLEAFKRKGQIGEEERDLLQKMIKHTGIRWGYDKAAKSSILEQEDGDSFGVFEKGFEHILKLIAKENSTIEFSQVESIGEIITLIEGLHQDISLFLKQKYTLKSFIEMSINFAKSYLYLDEEADFFFKELKKITPLAATSTYPYSFESFKRLLQEIFAKKGSREKTYSAPPISFSSIETSPPIDKSLFFIGLDSESFPKKSSYRSLHELEQMPTYEKKPLPAEKARYFLLRAICSSKISLSFSFTSNNPIDGKNRGPSPILEEMIHALSLPAPVIHPFLPFDKSYFQSANPFMEQYELFLTSQEKEKKPFTFHKVTKEKQSIKQVTYKELALLAQSPAGFFYNLSTKLFENKFSTPTMFDDSEFVLSYLDRAIITKDQAKEKCPSLQEWIDQGKLPAALFQKAATKELHQTIEAEKMLLKKVTLSTDPYFNLYLDKNIKNPIFKENILFLPAITQKIGATTYIIKGEIQNLTDKGILSFKKAANTEIWKSLPKLILLSHLDTDIALQIHFLKEEIVKTFTKEQLKPLLIPLLSYYDKALEDISPIVPEAIDEYIANKSISFSTIKNKLQSRFKDPYLEKGEPTKYQHFEKELNALCTIFGED